jgi:hypothetical protein
VKLPLFLPSGSGFQWGSVMYRFYFMGLHRKLAKELLLRVPGGLKYLIRNSVWEETIFLAVGRMCCLNMTYLTLWNLESSVQVRWYDSNCNYIGNWDQRNRNWDPILAYFSLFCILLNSALSWDTVSLETVLCNCYSKNKFMNSWRSSGAFGN